MRNISFDNNGEENHFCDSPGNLCKLVTLLSLIILLLSFLQTLTDRDMLPSHFVMAQTSSTSTSNNNSSNSTQQWIDKTNNMKIQFNNIPKSPMIDTKTQLRFAVQNLTDSKNIGELHARVVVATNSSGQLRTFKFDNISSSNGDFSMNYIFPDSGTYQVITRVDSNNLSTLGAFKVNVPFQPFGTVTAPTSSFAVIIIAGIIIAAVAVSLVLVLQHRQRITR